MRDNFFTEVIFTFLLTYIFSAIVAGLYLLLKWDPKALLAVVAFLAVWFSIYKELFGGGFSLWRKKK